MEKLWQKYGGVILFYGIILICIVLINGRFQYLNEQNKVQDNVIAYQG